MKKDGKTLPYAAMLPNLGLEPAVIGLLKRKGVAGLFRQIIDF